MEFEDEDAYLADQERQHAEDRLRCDNPVLHGWLAERRAAFPAWAEGAERGEGVEPYPYDDVWDFGVESVDRLERLIRATFTSYEDARAREDGPFMLGAAWYLGEVHNRACGTVWQVHPDARKFPPYKVQPFVTIPWERKDEYEDEEGVEDDARPLYGPVNGICQLFKWGPDRHLRDDMNRYAL
ncbi:hypothetical protein ACFT9I_31355 [Streptomyces sp. NPDC057137]|uniref:hypothetical protein n=1 Tax=Streptomyces sp. NPDC057137 TaxID=3346030 RepID=UPI003644257B